MINEALLFLMIVLCIRFLSPIISPKGQRVYANILIAILLITIIINWTAIIISGVIGFIQARRLKRLKKLKKQEATKDLPVPNAKKLSTESTKQLEEGEPSINTSSEYQISESTSDYGTPSSKHIAMRHLRMYKTEKRVPKIRKVQRRRSQFSKQK